LKNKDSKWDKSKHRKGIFKKGLRQRKKKKKNTDSEVKLSWVQPGED